jgi:hypothetical protein
MTYAVSLDGEPIETLVEPAPPPVIVRYEGESIVIGDPAPRARAPLARAPLTDAPPKSAAELDRALEGMARRRADAARAAQTSAVR